MDIFDQYIYEELVLEYERSNLTDEDYEELFVRFCNLDHMDKVKPYLFVMRFFGLGTCANSDASLNELKSIMNDNPILNGLYYDLCLCVDPSNTKLLKRFKDAVDAGYSNKYLREKSNIKLTERIPSSQYVQKDRSVNAIGVKSNISVNETLTKDIVVSLLKKTRKANATSFRTFTLPSSYKKVGDSAFQGIREVDMLIIPRSYVEIASNAFAWSVIHQIVIPDSVTVFGKNSFKGFTGVIECSPSSTAFNYAKRNNIRTLVR